MLDWTEKPLWRGRQARWTVSDMRSAIHTQCRICNAATQWDETNDCVSPICPLFVYRPGAQRIEVKNGNDTYARATKNAAKASAASKRNESLHSRAKKGLKSPTSHRAKG